MDIERLREYCLSLGEVSEKTPFGKFISHSLDELKVTAKYDSVLVFYVCEHMFCMVDMDDFTYSVVKNTPEKIAELHETRTSVERQRNMSARYWILCGAKRQAGFNSTSAATFPTPKFSTS